MADIGKTEIDATSAEVVAALVQAELTVGSIYAALVQDESARAVPGLDAIKFPKADTLSAVDKVGGTESTRQALTFTTDTLNLNVHAQVPVRLEDLAKIQAGVDVEAEILTRAASAMVRKVDSILRAEVKKASASAPDHILQLTGSSNTKITLADILAAQLVLNNANVPRDGRKLVVSNAQESALLAMSDFIDASKYGAGTSVLANGEIGRIYGLPVIVDGGLEAAEALVFHSSHVAWGRQMEATWEQQRAPLGFLATDYSLSMLFGAKVLRGGICGVWLNATGTV